MTQHSQNGEGVEVIQSDRDRAADAVFAIRGRKDGDWQGRIREGKCDDGVMVQAFASYRQSLAREPATADVGRENQQLRNALIAMGRMIPGVILDDRVSSDFLANLPEELAHYSLFRAAPSSGHAMAEGDLPQPSSQATALALAATPDDFPKDSYGLALWLDRALATTPPTTNDAIPAGWKLVPQKPTLAMVEAWANASVPAFLIQQSPDEEANRLAAECDWAAMLAATPIPEAAKEVGA